MIEEAMCEKHCITHPKGLPCRACVAGLPKSSHDLRPIYLTPPPSPAPAGKEE